MKTELVPRDSVEQIVACRDEALRLYEKAHDAIKIASEAVQTAHNMARRAAPLCKNNFNHDRAPEIARFLNAVNMPDSGEFMRVARKITDLECWAHLITVTDLERLMDKQAKDQLRKQMAYVPDKVDRRGQLITGEESAKGLPPITVDNIYATLESFRADAGVIFRRGMANAFSTLDRRFKSHDGFKVGSRMIITRMFNDHGRLGWGGTRDTMIDIERVFAILDGKPEGGFQSTLHMLERERNTWEPQQSMHEHDYFRVRCFKNGNAHLWFTRDDLVGQVNKLLAEHYGEVIGDGQTAQEDPLENRKTTPAKRFGFFPTPAAAVEEMFCGRWGTQINVLRRKDEPQLRIMEPSAGTGNLARRCIRSGKVLDEWSGGRDRHAKDYRFDNLVDCVEVQPALADGLRAEGIYNKVICADFLSLSPVTGYDLVVMNPPFDMERDIDHVTHAFKFLKPGGSLHAIMSAGTEFRQTRKSIAFRAFVESLGGSFRDLPNGSFSEVGTYVNTAVLSVTKPETP